MGLRWPAFDRGIACICLQGMRRAARQACSLTHIASQGSAGLMLPRRLEPTSKVLAAERLACIAEAEATENSPPLTTWQRIPGARHGRGQGGAVQARARSRQRGSGRVACRAGRHAGCSGSQAAASACHCGSASRFAAQRGCADARTGQSCGRQLAARRRCCSDASTLRRSIGQRGNCCASGGAACSTGWRRGELTQRSLVKPSDPGAHELVGDGVGSRLQRLAPAAAGRGQQRRRAWQRAHGRRCASRSSGDGRASAGLAGWPGGGCGGCGGRRAAHGEARRSAASAHG